MTIVSMQDFTYMLKWLYKISITISIVNLLFLIFSFLGYIDITKDLTKDISYSMGFGYACMLPAIVLLCDNIHKFSVLNFIYVIGLVTSIILYASRGPLLGIFFAYVYFGFRKMFYKNLLIFYLMAGSLFILLINHNEILEGMLNAIEKLGLYSRTLDFMVNDSGNLSGREIIWNTLLREIFENPFRLRGINAEWHTFGTYAHNIFIELCYQLGILIGFILSGVIVFVALSNLLVKNLGRLELLKLIFLFASLPTLLVSRSLWTEYSFWIWIGLNISTISFSRYLKNNRR